MFSQFYVFLFEAEQGIRSTNKGTFLVDEKLQEREMEFLPLISHQFKYMLEGEWRPSLEKIRLELKQRHIKEVVATISIMWGKSDKARVSIQK